jgi:hypothetical protein
MKTPTVELLKQLRDEGMSIRKIFMTLKEQGYISATGKPLSASTIYIWLKGHDKRVTPNEVHKLMRLVLSSKHFSPEQKNKIIQAMVED